MKTLYTLLKTAVFVNLGVFVGSSLYTWCGHQFHMSWYVSQAMPWHMLILIRAGFTALILFPLLLALWLVKKRLKKPT